MSSYRPLAVAIFFAISIGTAAYGGKLGSMRDKASKKSRPAAAKQSRPSRPPRESKREQTEQTTSEPARKPASKPSSQPRTASNSKSKSKPGSKKLDSIRAVTNRSIGPTQSSHAANRPSRPSRSRPASRPHHPHHPHRRRPVDLGLQFGSFVRPTVIEEHHYYPAEPLIVSEPVFVPNPVAPPVMPPEPTVIHVEPQTEIVAEDIIVGQEPVDWLNPVQVRFEIDYASDEEDVSRMGFGLLMNATGGLGIDTGMRLFREQDGEYRDHMWIGDANVVYELFPTETVRTRAGVGVHWLADSYGGEAGLNLTVGTELFAGPIVFSGEADFGTIGDADLLHGRLTAAIRQGEHLEWFAGYDYLDVGGVEIQGVLAGLRFRF